MIRQALLLASGLALSGCVVDTTVVQGPAHPAPAEQIAAPAGMQYLYGSGEAAALSVQAYNALVDQVRARMAKDDPKGPHPRTSVVLTPDATLAIPRFQPCGDKPAAAVFDVDETMLLNLGYEADDAERAGPYDPARWDRWEKTGAMKVAAVPGAVEAVRALRAMGVTVIFNTNRAAANAEQTEAALNFAGLGPARHGETLFLKGDVDGKSAKDGRRNLIAQRWCVVAMGGDQLGDFTDAFAGLTPPERRVAVASPVIGAIWGRGWFVLPNPVYGTGIGSTFDQTFPPATRWTDPQEKH
ncbi:5'-nucleotidase, lipoprotein e(P4) family [Sphingomonas sp.]|uniref:5'-nucleotidase, lipoprotein e(P4) family n=1 Tax=Sphingomonas sp. TaxID=28214 RepID=UPI002FD988C3